MIVAPPGQDFFHFKIWKDIKILGEGRPFVSQCQGLLGNEQLSKTIWFILDLHLLKIFFLIARNFKFWATKMARLVGFFCCQQKF
jgi:hypothetical protein